ncbi:MAG: beta-glucosidase [Victivallales bacterium]|nr:beta-glucosidase [Victivallales bacterium]
MFRVQCAAQSWWVLAFSLALGLGGATMAGEGADTQMAPRQLRAAGHHLRIDLMWRAEDAQCFEIWRADRATGPFQLIRERHFLSVFTDFIGRDGITHHYRVRPVAAGEATLPFSETVAGTSQAEDDEAFLTGVQEAGIRYFYDFAHPISGLAREWGYNDARPHARTICAIGATGMGMLNLVVGLERGVLPAKGTKALVLKMLRFLDEDTERFDGAFSHWMDGNSGKALPFAKIGGADIVETAFLMQGILVLREYFTDGDAVSREIRQRADALWRAVEWDKFADPRQRLYWHWPVPEGKHGMRITGSNEGHLPYLLAVASPSHPAPPEVYHSGWVGTHQVLNKRYYDVPLEVGRPHGFPLFWTHYSYLGFDPRGIRDRHVADYFEHHRRVARIHYLYALDNPKKFKGYGAECWGLTSSSGPKGYGGWTPVRHDNGTIAPTAALSSMPYAPVEALAMLKGLYRDQGGELWREFGFMDAFNPTENWVAPLWIGIDVGPIAPMIENHRTGLCWRLFMQAPEVRKAIRTLGIQRGER